MITTRVPSLDKDIEVIVSEGLSPRAQSKIIAAAAREVLNEAKASNRASMGRAARHRTVVDGRENAPLESVRPDGGTIVFSFEVFGETVGWILRALRQVSPVRRGRYRRSHLVFADGVQTFDPVVIARALEVIIMNVQPYARKIERGLSRQAPAGVYEAVAAVARRRFGNAAMIRFSYRDVIGSTAVNTWAAKRHARLTGRGKRRARRDQLKDIRQPAIIITKR